MYQNDPQRVLTGEVRLSYAHLDKPHSANPGDEARYSVSLLIPKTDTATFYDILASIEAAAQEGIAKVWGGTRPTKIPGTVYIGETPCTLYDGDGLTPKGKPWGDECKGHWVLRTASKSKPQVVHQSNINVDLAPSDVYGGMYARVTVRFYPYNNQNGMCVGCGLGNVMKTRDGEAFSGQTSAADDFADVGQAGPAYPQPGAPAAYTHAPVAPVAPQAGYRGIDPLTGRPYGN